MCNSNKNKIIQMYYTEHLRPTDISKALDIDNGYIIRIIKQDERYTKEKQQRKEFNKQKNKEQTIAYIKKSRLSREDDDKIHENDESESIQNQKSMLINYAIERSWDIYNIYCDEDYSGIDSE